jgi:hypothetical protein
MTLSFKYKTVKRPDKTEVKTPSIPITLNGKNIKFDAIALIDSGADVSAISQEMAEILGLDLNKEKDFAFGIGGRVESIESKIDFVIEKGHEHYSLSIPVKVILGKYDFPILLGREGFFDEFVISFNQKHQKVLLKKVD